MNLEKICLKSILKHVNKIFFYLILINFMIDIIGSFTFIAFILDISRGKMKNYNRFYESNYRDPLRLLTYITLA